MQSLNSYTDSSASSQANALACSDAASALKLNASEFDALSLKCLERRLELLQWDVYQDLLAGANKVMIDVKAKKDMVTVQAPAAPNEVCLPYAGTLALSSPKGSRLFTSLFGIPFYIQPRADALSSDIVIPAWSARTVTKACDCFFNCVTMKRGFVALREALDSDGALEDLKHIQFILLAESRSAEKKDQVEDMIEACTSGGGCV